MTTIRTPDGRRLENFERADATIARLRDGRDAWLDRELALARDVLEIAEKHAYFVEGASSAVEYLSRLGYDGHRVLDLLLLARAVKAEPKVEALLREKRIIFQAAVALGKILPHPEFVRPDDEWLRMAELSTLRDLRRAIRYRVEIVKQQARTLNHYEAEVDDLTLMDLARCEEVAALRAKEPVTRGQTLKAVARHYLEEYDPVERAVGTRRVGPTAERPEDRYVPRHVVARIWRRSGGYCEVGGCPRLIEEICHIRPHDGHRTGEPSGREETDLFGACGSHHKLFDARYLFFLAWVDGRPAFFNRRHESIYPAPRSQRELPEDWLKDFVDPSEPPSAPASETPPDVVMDRAPDTRRECGVPARDLAGASLARDRTAAAGARRPLPGPAPAPALGPPPGPARRRAPGRRCASRLHSALHRALHSALHGARPP